jgi:hypothetical protein
MSTQQRRLRSAIQRIAREDPQLASVLKDFQNRGAQGSSVGTGQSVAAEEAQICCDGSTGGNANPGTDTKNPDDGGQDGLNPDDPANLDMASGCIENVTDCATGETVCFCGDDWIPPDRWDDPQEPPVAEYYEEGYYWYIDQGPAFGATPQLAAKHYSELHPTYAPHCVCLEDGDWMLYDRALEPGESVTGSCGECGRGLGYVVVKISCGDSTESYCTEVPYEDAWPSDGCVNLAIKSGTIVGSKYDPENDGSYSTAMDEICLCDANGNQTCIKASGSSEGGWKSINPAVDGGDGYMYDSSGLQIARISGSEYSDPNV